MSSFDPSSPIVMRGWLLKLKRNQRLFMSTWNRRWFTIQDGRLNWYSGKRSKNPSGSIDLEQFTDVEPFEIGGQGCFSFIIRTSDRNLFLRAESAQKLKYWKTGLQLQMDLFAGGTRLGPPTASNRRRRISFNPRKTTKDRKEFRGCSRTPEADNDSNEVLTKQHPNTEEKETRRVRTAAKLSFEYQDEHKHVFFNYTHDHETDRMSSSSETSDPELVNPEDWNNESNKNYGWAAPSTQQFEMDDGLDFCGPVYRRTTCRGDFRSR